MQFFHYLIAALGAFAAGLVNALAGGGTLITFPLLTALGIPPVSANVTNTLVLIPGYFGGIYAQRKELRGQKKRLWGLLPVAAVGGLIGGLLLLRTGEKIFEGLIPFLILLASFLLAVGEPVRKWILSRTSSNSNRGEVATALLPVLLASIYGGYFGGVMSVIIIAILGLVFDDSLTRLNALKQTIAFAANALAAILFIFSGQVNWPYAILMAVFALLGGAAGGKLAGKLAPEKLRWLVVTIGIVAAVIFFIKTY